MPAVFCDVLEQSRTTDMLRPVRFQVSDGGRSAGPDDTGGMLGGDDDSGAEFAAGG
jgi:hypothetical protein